MKYVCRSRIAAAVAIVTLAHLGLPPSSDGAELPDDSYYQLDVVLETQAGETLKFAEMQGKPVIVAMFYASCPQVCPMTISTVRAIESQVLPEHRNRLSVLMITLDPERDTPDELAALAGRHRVDDERWRFARTAPTDVRPLAALLGVQYRNLPDGNINHSTLILLLGADGREIARTGKLGVPAPAFVQKLVALVAAD
jgi:protein SCO1/2